MVGPFTCSDSTTVAPSLSTLSTSSVTGVCQRVVAEGFAEVVVGLQAAEAVIDRAERILGFGDDLAPPSEGSGVTPLEHDHSDPGAVGEGRVGVELGSVSKPSEAGGMARSHLSRSH